MTSERLFHCTRPSPQFTKRHKLCQPLQRIFCLSEHQSESDCPTPCHHRETSTVLQSLCRTRLPQRPNSLPLVSQGKPTSLDNRALLTSLSSEASSQKHSTNSGAPVAASPWDLTQALPACPLKQKGVSTRHTQTGTPNRRCLTEVHFAPWDSVGPGR